MNDEQFRLIIEYFNLSWEGYCKVRKGVKKRISHHMQELGYRNINDYLLMLQINPSLHEYTKILMSVSISRFFRDQYLWKTLDEIILPAIISNNSERIKVWTAGCSCGEETYSFKILWEELSKRFDKLPELELWATDINPIVLDKARDGIYSSSSLKELSESYQLQYFIPLNDSKFAIKKSIKAGILWKHHDLLTDKAPQTKFQIVFLRNNILTYYTEALKVNSLQRIVNSLSIDGYLIIGAHERLLYNNYGLVQFSCNPQIFKKKVTN